MSIKSRIVQFLEIMGISQGKFEKTAGLSNGYINGLKNSPGADKLQKILCAYPELNRDWLLTGEGSMLKSEKEESENEDTETVGNKKSSGDFRMVPLINIDSVGGIHSLNSIESSEQYIIKMMPFTEAREGDVAILQSGNSMSPTIPPGSALLIREVSEWREYFGYGNIYVLWLRDGRRITKEIRRYDPDPKNYVWCVSYNPDVADEELPRSMIRGVWKVIKYLADFGW